MVFLLLLVSWLFGNVAAIGQPDIYFYGLFIAEISKTKKDKPIKDENLDSVDNIPLEKINNMRYSDWIITTPLMLLALSMLLGYENKIPVRFKPFLLVLF